MPTEVIFCPACNHKLRVPEELMGQSVQCPKCRATFMAPPRVGADAPLVEAATAERRDAPLGRLGYEPLEAPYTRQDYGPSRATQKR